MEFSFGMKRWVPAEMLLQEVEEPNKYALGLHAPGFFDKVLNVDKCLLQSDPANKVCKFISHSFPFHINKTHNILVSRRC